MSSLRLLRLLREESQGAPSYNTLIAVTHCRIRHLVLGRLPYPRYDARSGLNHTAVGDSDGDIYLTRHTCPKNRVLSMKREPNFIVVTEHKSLRSIVQAGILRETRSCIAEGFDKVSWILDRPLASHGELFSNMKVPTCKLGSVNFRRQMDSEFSCLFIVSTTETMPWPARVGAGLFLHKMRA